MKAQKARILRVFCCSLCVLCRLEAPKARVLRVFCGLEAKKLVFYECFVVWRSPGGPNVCSGSAPEKGQKHVEAQMSLG